MNIYTIYRVTNIINNKVYIGFDSHWPNRRNFHKCYYQKHDNKFYRAIRKYGFDSFIFEPIYQSLDSEHTLKVMENYFITESNSFNNGYNSTLGGEGTLGVKQTSSQIKKRTSSYGYKNRRIVAKSGIEHPSFGKKRPDASARMMSDNPAKKPEVIKKLKTFTGELSSAYDDTIYTFIHKDGTILRTTQYNLRTTFNLSSGSVSRMVRKTPRYKSVKGWSLL